MPSNARNRSRKALEMSGVPIGTVCPFAGQVDPVSGAVNSVWSSRACSPTQPAAAKPSSDGPVNYLESQGWMLCDGRWLSQAGYPELYSVIGNLYGSQSGSSGDQFRIPDYRGLFLRGFDAGAGMDPDAGNRTSPDGQATENVVGSIQCDAFQTHTHDYKLVQTSGISQQGNAAGTSATSTPSGDPNSPALTSSETRSRNVNVNYVIKFR
ncbi:MAG: phage tail protein [Acidobacteriota bacterium]